MNARARVCCYGSTSSRVETEARLLSTQLARLVAGGWCVAPGRQLWALGPHGDAKLCHCRCRAGCSVAVGVVEVFMSMSMGDTKVMWVSRRSE